MSIEQCWCFNQVGYEEGSLFSGTFDLQCVALLGHGRSDCKILKHHIYCGGECCLVLWQLAWAPSCCQASCYAAASSFELRLSVSRQEPLPQHISIFSVSENGFGLHPPICRLAVWVVVCCSISRSTSCFAAVPAAAAMWAKQHLKLLLNYSLGLILEPILT